MKVLEYADQLFLVSQLKLSEVVEDVVLAFRICLDLGLVNILKELIRHTNYHVRLECIKLLKDFDFPQRVEILKFGTTDSELQVAYQSAFELSRLEFSDKVSVFKDLLTNDNFQSKYLALQTLGRYEFEDKIALLKSIANSKQTLDLRLVAIRLLADYEFEDKQQFLLDLKSSPSFYIRSCIDNILSKTKA